jgi:hypothetical protein
MRKLFLALVAIAAIATATTNPRDPIYAQSSSPLNRALCAKDWNTAISIATQQINAATDAGVKQQWQAYRDRLVAVSQGSLTFNDSEFAQLGCPQTSMNAPLPTFEFRVQTQADGKIWLNQISSNYDRYSFAGTVQNPHDFTVKNARVHYQVSSAAGVFEGTTLLRPTTIRGKQRASFSQSLRQYAGVSRVIVTKITADPAITPIRSASKSGDCSCPYDIASSGAVCGYSSTYFRANQSSDTCYR